MITKKGRDLKVGDVVKGLGVIYNVDLDPDPDGFWTKPNIGFYCINDSYNGPAGTWLQVDEDFEVYTDRKDIVKVLKRVSSEMARYIADMMQYRKEFLELKEQIVTKLNKEMRDEKERVKIKRIQKD